MVGGGLQLIGRDHATGVSAAFALVVSLTFPPELFNEQYAFEVVLEGENGTPLELAESAAVPGVQGDAVRADPADRGTQLPRQRGARAGRCPPDRTWCCTSTPACRCHPVRCWSGGPESTASPARNGPSPFFVPAPPPAPVLGLIVMRIATWNINSDPCPDRPAHRLAGAQRRRRRSPSRRPRSRTRSSRSTGSTELGYQVAHHGTNQWNGVAVLSRVGHRRRPGRRARRCRRSATRRSTEARAIGVLCGGVRVWSLYVPNGRAIGDPHYDYKLAWLGALRDYGAKALAADPNAQIALCGDFNIAPTDDDIWSVDYYRGSTHVTPPERQAFFDAGRCRIHRRRPPATPRTRRLHLLGLHPDWRSRSAAACGSTSRWPVRRWPPGSPVRSSTARNARANCPPTTRRSIVELED